MIGTSPLEALENVRPKIPVWPRPHSRVLVPPFHDPKSTIEEPLHDPKSTIQEPLHDPKSTIQEPLLKDESCVPPSPDSSEQLEHLIVDTGAFIRLKQLHEFRYKNIHITPKVAAEIRDRIARQNLQLLLDVPKISIPTEMDLAFVKRFAQETGDLGFLSDSDLEVISLTYMLQRLSGDLTNLKSSPSRIIETTIETDGITEFDWGIDLENKNISEMEGSETKWNDDELDNADECGGGWICEDNLDEFCMKQRIGTNKSNNETEKDSIRRLRIACLTTDYSIQNVLVQLGLSVLSIDGLRIRAIKKWSLLCRWCKKVMMDTTKKFCGHCGNDTLRRVVIEFGSDGKMMIQEPKSKVNLRGKVYPIPKPRGGRQGDLILCEDQIYIGGKERLLKQQQKASDKEKALHDPFNPDNLYDQKGWYNRNSNGTYKGLTVNPMSQLSHFYMMRWNSLCFRLD